MELISQVKEAESHHNREMRKLAEDRERCIEQQAEIVSDCRSQQSPLSVSLLYRANLMSSINSVGHWSVVGLCQSLLITWQSLDEIISLRKGRMEGSQNEKA